MSDPTPPGPPVGPPPGWTPPPPAELTPASESSPSSSRRGVQVLVVGLALLAALLVVAVAVLVPRVVDDLADDGSAVAVRDEGAVEGDEQGHEEGEPSLADVVVVADLSTEHRDDEDIEYDQVPPIGGPHDDEWLACGAYEEPVRNENAVHDLEHGTVWITYDPDRVGGGDVAALEQALPDNGIMSPYPGLPAPVVVTVWGVQLHLSGSADPLLPLFIEEYGDGSSSPEPFGSCEGGLERPEGDVQGTPV